MPVAKARRRPFPVLALMSSRSNSESPPMTVNINLPCGVVVSAQASWRERNYTPFSLIASTSPGDDHDVAVFEAGEQFCNSPIAVEPDTFSRQTFAATAAFDPKTCCIQ